MNNNFKVQNNQCGLSYLLKKYGDIRSVYRTKNGFEIKDLYLNGDGELRLESLDEISFCDLAEEFTSNYAYTTCIHPLFKSPEEIIKDKCESLDNVESWISTYVYEETDNDFMEHSQYILDNIDFSKLKTFNYHRGVIEFLSSKEQEELEEYHFICENEIKSQKRKIKNTLMSYGDIKYLQKDSSHNVFITNLSLDEEDNIILEKSSALTGKVFEQLFKQTIYRLEGDGCDFLEKLYELTTRDRRKVKLESLKNIENILSFKKYSCYNTEIIDFIDDLFSKTDINKLDSLDQTEAILDFIESRENEKFFIVKF